MRNVLGLLLMLSLVAWARPYETEHAVADAVELYKWFHANPELSNQEKETSARLASELRKVGLKVEEGIGGYGIMGVLEGGGPGPTVLYRADTDGLPVTERTGLPYASKNKGVMHACGHDVHMSVAVAALRVMAENRQNWGGKIIFVGQPAEEVGQGARRMLKDPRFHKILEEHGKPSLALALHDSAIPVGLAAVGSGYVSANVDSVDIIVHGVGGHGAYPHLTVDPIVIGSEIVMALQTIVSRRLAPGSKAVVTVGRFTAGTKHNIIPREALLQLTVRSYEDGVRKKLLAEIGRVATAVAEAHGAPRPPEVIHKNESTRAGYNDPAWSERLRNRFQRVLGAPLMNLPPTMGGEDFAEYHHQLGCPGVMFVIGTQEREYPGGKRPGLHSDLFAPLPEPTLKVGTRLVVEALREALRETAP